MSTFERNELQRTEQQGEEEAINNKVSFRCTTGYGFGNNMTGDEKLKLIYGSLLFFFFLFICGYAFN